MAVESRRRDQQEKLLLSDTLKKVSKKSTADGRQSKADARSKEASVSSASSASKPAVKKKPEVATLKGAERASFPRAIRPMLATLVDEPFHDRDWLYEV